jgi:hypothetical protein
VEGISSGHRKSEERRLMAEIDVNLERLRDEFAMSTLSSSLSLTHPITDYEKQEVFQDRTEVEKEMADKTTQWKTLDIDAYRKLLAECKTDEEFRRRLKEVPEAKEDRGHVQKQS